MSKAPSLVLVRDGGHVTLSSRLARRARRSLTSVGSRTAEVEHPRSLRVVKARISALEAEMSEADNELAKLATATRAASRLTALHDCAQLGALRS